jgi:hypothetical protein
MCGASVGLSFASFCDLSFGGMWMECLLPRSRVEHIDRVDHKEGFGTLVASFAVRVKCFVFEQCRDQPVERDFGACCVTLCNVARPCLFSGEERETSVTQGN